MVMQWTVNPPPSGTTGSIPVISTKIIIVRWQRGPMQWIANPQNRRFESDSHFQVSAPLAQLVRVSACHAEGQGFKSPAGRQFCLCVYGYPYVSSESPKTLITVPEARSKRSNTFSARLGHCVTINKFNMYL